MNPSYDSWPHSPVIPPSQPMDSTDNKKKPRHRHSPAQLIALNELYDKTEHPSLDQRATLATRLGMETKTVNAWFQNKRASTKKRSKGGAAQYDLPPINSLIGSASSSAVNTPRQHDLDDFYLDDNFYPSPPSLELAHHHAAFYTGDPENSHLFADSDPMPRRMRMRPTTEQTNALKKLYNKNPHPSKEERENLGEHIGMRYQSITNWFQNQRSLAKKRKEDEADGSLTTSSQKSMSDILHESRMFSAFPPPSTHPSLPLSLAQQPNHPSPTHTHRRSPSISRRHPSVPDDGPHSPRRSSPRQSSTPYQNTGSSLSRPRRSRPEPYQLNALKELFTRTSTPSIEERSALAFEIGMDVGKVTNWFRNLRQTARKRAKKFGGDYDGDEDSVNGFSRSVSRSGTPSFQSSSSSNEDIMDLDRDVYDMHAQSEAVSDDDFQEAVTPSPEPSPSPPLPTYNGASRHAMHVNLGHPDFGFGPGVDYAELEKFTATRYSGVKLEDALLLLGFHQHIMQ